MRFPQHFEYLKNADITWFNPCWGYHGFWKRLDEFQKERKVDFQKAWSHRDMKRNKEIYATALAALCMQQDAPTKYGWWFTKPKQDPPDGIIATPLQDDIQNVNIMHGREVEVVEYLGGSLLETIRRKLDRKAYEPNTILVCLLSPQGEIPIFDFASLAQELQKISLPLAHIFLAGHGFQITPSFSRLNIEQQIEEMYKILFVQLLPNYALINSSPNIVCKNFRDGHEQAWLKFSGIGKGTGFQKVTVDTPPKLFD